MTGATAAVPALVIDSQSPSAGYFAELWDARELLAFFVWRDLKVRYRQTALGAGWALLQPLATTAVFALFFGRLLETPSDGVPYPAFALVALVPWTYMTASISGGATTLLTQQALVAKVYFPRLLLPAAAVTTPLADATLALLMTLLVLAWYGIVPTATMLTLPIFAGVALITALGLSAWLSALTVRYRDMRYVLPFALQLWLFVTPIAYSSAEVPDAWRSLYALNPLATVVDGWRWALLSAPAPPLGALLTSVTVALLLLVVGVAYFRRVEHSFADVA